MSRYRDLVSGFVTLAHVLGPLLLLVSTLMYAFGIGLNSDGFSSYVEGVIGVYALMLFIPIYIRSAHLVGAEKPRHGLAVFVVGLVGACGGVFAMGYRVVVGSLDKSGMPSDVMATYMLERETHWEMLAMAPATLSFPIASILLGAGLLRLTEPRTNRLIPYLFVLAGIAFVVAQGSEAQWALKSLYPLSAVLWLVGFGTMARSTSGKETDLAH